MKSWVDANRTTTGNHQMMLVHDGYPASGHSVAYSRLGSKAFVAANPTTDVK